MKFETLKQNKRKKFVIGLVVLVAVISTLSLVGSRAKYRTTDSIPLVNGTINYKPNDLNLVAVNIENDNGEYIYSEDIPSSGYYLDDSKSYCEVKGVKDNSILIQYSNNKLEVSDITKKGTRCYAYFNKTESKTCPSGASACETIMTNTNTIGERTDFSKIVTATTTGVMYKAEDDYGTSYYFAGAPTDNWVEFAGMYWRIIRINGDGTIRMIYQGDFANTTGGGTQIGISAFNSSFDDNMYVGYMYTSGQVHGIGTASTIKGVLDSWYDSNLASYVSNIATGNGAIFCNDRTPYSGSGTGANKTYYAAYNRLINNKTPSFKCMDSGDRFSTSIGLITADEVVSAGGLFNTNNNNYYLYTDQYYWTMSPWYADSGGYAIVFNVYSNGNLFGNGTVDSRGVRPVINLKADVNLMGSGTSTDPYVVS